MRIAHRNDRRRLQLTLGRSPASRLRDSDSQMALLHKSTTTHRLNIAAVAKRRAITVALPFDHALINPHDANITDLPAD
jgi:hypothetical protein